MRSLYSVLLLLIIAVSLGSTERSADLEVVIDFAGLGASVEGHVGTGAVLTLDLDVDVAQVLN